MDSLLSTTISSRFGAIVLVWTETPRVKIHRIFLPREGVQKIMYAHSGIRPPLIEKAAERIASILSGIPQPSSIELIEEGLAELPSFQRRILTLEATIPFGRISTYRALATAADSPSSARAAAYALSHNPFPILIPCHRIISSSGDLAGYQGGIAMKQQLLRQEGLPFVGDRVDFSQVDIWSFPAH